VLYYVLNSISLLQLFDFVSLQHFLFLTPEFLLLLVSFLSASDAAAVGASLAAAFESKNIRDIK